MGERHADLKRIFIAFTTLAAAHAAFVACGSTNESKRGREDGGAGEGGALEGGAPASGGSTATGGRGGETSQGGVSGSIAGSMSGGVPNDAGAPGDGGSPGDAGSPSSGGAPGGGAGGAGQSSEGGAGGDVEGGAAGAAGAAGDGGDGNVTACITEGSRITIGFSASNAEHVTNLQWIDSDGTLIANVAASGGNGGCGDPSEFFGEAYGAPEGRTPLVVVGGSRSTATACGLDRLITSTPKNCADADQIPFFTEYHFYDGAKASQMRVTRRITFTENSPAYNATALRMWQPRVPLSTFPSTIYPKATNDGVTTTAASTCPGDCIFTAGNDWNKQWFAMTGPSGYAVIVRRDPSLGGDVNMTINWDSFSTSNLSSFVITQPAEGFKSTIEEIEYLCFADLKSWPQVDRDAAKLPDFCGP